ncbi:hypothetical protein [Serratia marcescens]|uniref:hypothetical protein n=1 Tax=Serratia marcescens TaxID=615 RepID=UPI00074535FA|nr:hypothetical protein [Serratia marcescens]CVA86802.1 Uncharacterised protein [Serratia marcescens]
MGNKLSELSKPVAWTWSAYGMQHATTEEDESAELILDGVDVCPLYSQEYVSALLADLEFEKQNNAGIAGMVEDYETKLEAKDKRIADLEAGLLNSHHRLMNTTQNCSEWERKAISNFDECANMSQRIEELEAKLATPVRLPDPDENDYGYQSISYLQAIDAINDAGFTVEGDE